MDLVSLLPKVASTLPISTITQKLNVQESILALDILDLSLLELNKSSSRDRNRKVCLNPINLKKTIIFLPSCEKAFRVVMNYRIESIKDF